MNVSAILPKLKAVAKTATGWQARCPAHDDKTPSLSVSEGSDGRLLLHCHAGCSVEAITAALSVTKADLFNGQSHTQTRTEVAIYPYHGREGNLLFEVVRYAPKDFRQRRPDHAGGWIWNTKDIDRVLFRLPELLRDIGRGLPVFVTEGEKDALAMVARGFTATCNPGGAGKWQDGYSETLRGADVIIIADKDEPGRKHASLVADRLQGLAKSVRVLELPDINGKTVKDAADFFEAGGDAGQLQAIIDAPPEPGPIAKLIRERAFNPDIEPPPLRSIYTLARQTVSTPGNLTTITSAIKTGKSAVIGAMAAAAMPHSVESDLLGFNSSNPDGKALLWFDSEQSEDDFWHCVARALRRAGIQRPPPWFYAYRLTGLGCKRSWEIVTEATRIAADKHGGIHSELLDGGADFVADVNDPEESNAFVATLQDMAGNYDCPIVSVIHFNPGTEKSRGHLGSQLERKAETNLALEKDIDGTTVIYSSKNRRAGIPKDTGPRFKFDVAAGMHVTIESRQFAKDAAMREDLLALAKDVFGERRSMRYSEIQVTVKKLLTVSDRTAERKVAEMKRLTVITPSAAGLYRIATPA
jgi:hypothetical protein